MVWFGFLLLHPHMHTHSLTHAHTLTHPHSLTHTCTHTHSHLHTTHTYTHIHLNIAVNSGTKTVVISDPVAAATVLRAEGKHPSRGVEENMMWIYRKNNLPLPMFFS